VGKTRAPYSPRLSRSDAALIPYAAQPRDGQVEEVLGIYRCMTAERLAYHYDGCPGGPRRSRRRFWWVAAPSGPKRNTARGVAARG
jgi:hypothetical protein